jgi:hypothetical protein
MENARTHAAVLRGQQVGFGRRIVKIVQAAEIQAALPMLNGRKDLLDAARLLVGNAAAPDRAGDLLHWCVRYLLPAREPGLKLGERSLGVGVRSVLGQDGCE